MTACWVAVVPRPPLPRGFAWAEVGPGACLGLGLAFAGDVPVSHVSPEVPSGTGADAALLGAVELGFVLLDLLLAVVLGLFVAAEGFLPLDISAFAAPAFLAAADSRLGGAAARLTAVPCGPGCLALSTGRS